MEHREQIAAQKAELLLRHEPKDEISFDQWLIQEIDASIQEAVQAELNTDPDHLLYVRSILVKDVLRAIKTTEKYIVGKYPDEIKFSKKQHFPTEWMKTNKGIKATMDKYPELVLLLDYVYNMNRRPKQIDLANMQSIAKGQTYTTKKMVKGKEKTLEHTYSCWIADNAFYTQTAQALSWKNERTAQRWINSLIEIGAIRVIGKGRHNRRVLSDGYFTQFDDGYPKKSFLINSRENRAALRNFKIIRGTVE